MKLTGENRSTQGKTCPISTSSTTNPTWTDPVSNPGLRGGRPATNCLRHGTAPSSYYFHFLRQSLSLRRKKGKRDRSVSYNDAVSC
jgi:hypothetical protein